MRKSLWLVSAGIAALASPVQAQDNTQPTGTPSAVEEAAADGTQSADIVITAQGRTQVLQDVPLAVSAVSAEALQNSGANDIRALNQLAPSLLVSSTGTEANGSARIRGIGTVGDNPGLESSVALFIDGVYRSRTGIGLNELGELERIEVLRGPQGTLFGRNASAGLINIVTKEPSFQNEGYAEATYGNYDYIRLGAGVTGPIGNTGLAYRLDGVYVERDGYYKVINAAEGTESRVNDRDRYFLRGQMLYEPNDTLSIRLIGDYSNRNESCCGAVYISTVQTFDPTPGVPGDFAVSPTNSIVDVMTSLGAIFPPDPFDREIAITPGRTYRGETEDWGISGQVDWDLGFGTLTSITAYRDYKAEQPGDFDYNNLDILFRADDGNSFRAFETFSQELRLQGRAFDDKLDWLVGAYYAKEDLHLRDNLKFGADYGAFASCRIATALPIPVPGITDPNQPGCLTPFGRAVITSPGVLGPELGAVLIGGLDRLSTVNSVGDNPANYFQDSENYAFFTHNIFNITDKLSLTLGLRYTNESKDFAADFNNTNVACPAQQAALLPVLGALPNVPETAGIRTLLGGILALTCQGNSSAALNGLALEDSRNEDEWTGTGILSYKPNDDTLLYASYSKGYKAGGFNLDRSALGNPLFPRSNADVTNLQFDAEKVDAYEIGVKFSTGDVRLNLAAFRQEFKNFQLNTFNGSVFIVQNVNGCGTDLGNTDSDPSPVTGACDPDEVEAGVISTGVELEATVFPAPDFTLTGGVTYANTRYRDNLVGTSDGTPLDPALFLLSGDNLSNAPELVVTGSATYTPELGNTGLTGLFYVDTRLTSDYNTGSDLFPEKEQDGYVLVNARIGVRGPDERWSVELWGQNLFDINYQQVAFNSPFQGANSRAHVTNFGATQGFPVANQLFSSYLAEPRTYGLTVRTRF